MSARRSSGISVMPLLDRLRNLLSSGDALRIVGFALFSAVSAFATLDGLWGISGNLPFALALTIGVQLAILWTAVLLFTARGWFRRLVAAGVYAMAVGLSVGYGYGFWYDTLSGAAHRNADFQAAYQELLEPLAARSSAFRDFARGAEEIAAYSADRFAEEVADGGTCGGPAQPGAGPLARRRAADNELFALLVPDLQESARQVEELVRAARAAVDAQDETALSETLAHARAVDGEAALRAWRDAAAERLEIGRSGWTENGETHRCPDAGLERRLAAALQVVLPPLPDQVSDIFVADRAASVRRAFGVLTFGLLGKAEFHRDRDGLPLATGLMMDLMILLLALYAHRASNPGGSGDGWPSGRKGRPIRELADALDGEPVLSSGALDGLIRNLDTQPHALLTIIERFMLRDKGRNYLLVPDPPATSWTIFRLARVLEASGLAKDKGLEVRGQLPDEWLAAHEPQLAEVQRWTPYVLRDGLYEALLLDLIRVCDRQRLDGALAEPRRFPTVIS